MRSKTANFHWWTVPALPLTAVFMVTSIGLLFANIALFSTDPVLIHTMNGTLPAVAGAVAVWASYRTVRLRPMAFWTPLPWFLVAWAVYYGFGPLVYVYGTHESVAYMDILYPVDDMSLLRTNILNMTGLLAVLGGVALLARLTLGRTNDQKMSIGHDPWRTAWLFLVIGIPIKYLLEIPYVLNLTNYTLPGSVQFLGSFSGLAILPLSVAAWQGRKGAKNILWVLVAAEIAVGIVMLSKLEIIKTVLLVMLGHYAVHKSLRTLIAVGSLVAITYVAILSPFVNYARILFGRSSAQDVTEALTAVQNFNTVGSEVLADLLPGVQSWWTRLAYPNAQAFAMAEFDQGKPGWTFAMIPYVLVPRFFDPDKPIMTPGVEFTRLLLGVDTSSTGLGFIGEAYWNGGWPAVFATGFYIGALFSVLGRVVSRAVASHKWLYAPLIFLSVFISLRPDDWFVPTYISSVLQVTVVVIILGVVAKPIVIRNYGARGLVSNAAASCLRPQAIGTAKSALQ